MLDQLDAADSVLVVCTETYYRRFRGHEVPGKGKGVDWEGALITQELYDRGSKTLKFVPVFLSAVVEDWIPEPLRAGNYYALTSQSDYERLYDSLLGQAGVEPQPVLDLKTKLRRQGTPLIFDEPALAEIAKRTPVGQLQSAPSADLSKAGREHLHLPAPLLVTVRARKAARTMELIYSMVADGATVREAGIEVNLKIFYDLLKKIEEGRVKAESLWDFGDKVARMVLPDFVMRWLRDHAYGHLVIIHDRQSSIVPWETIRVDGEFLAFHHGISRRHLSSGSLPERLSEPWRSGDTLHGLVIVNPTQDLAGAEAEGRAVCQFLEAAPRLRVRVLFHDEATKGNIIKALQLGTNEIVHFAGHGCCDPADLSRSGFVCAGDQVLTAEDLQSLEHPPQVLFLSATKGPRLAGIPWRGKTIRLSLAEALLAAGVANFVAPRWAESHEPAKLFAEHFYRGLLKGMNVGEAMVMSRKAIWEHIQSIDAVNYFHYGNANFAFQ